jgi:hypothetical protein
VSGYNPAPPRTRAGTHRRVRAPLLPITPYPVFAGLTRCMAKGADAVVRRGKPNAAVVAAWPTLPEAIRAGILAMVKAARR